MNRQTVRFSKDGQSGTLVFYPDSADLSLAEYIELRLGEGVRIINEDEYISIQQAQRQSTFDDSIPSA